MITFLLGFTLGIIVGVAGLACARSCTISTTQTNSGKEQRYADKE